jgi:probable phosphomutase (TIGR03848 family)
MATVILVRHGRTTANADGVLAGRAPGVRLDETGAAQAAAAAERLAGVSLARVVSSPLERCRQTATAVAKAQTARPRPVTDRGLTECDYGDWQGRALKDLAKEKLWKVVQSQPSAVEFPGGESMRAMQERAVAAVRRHDAAVEAEHGPHAVWVAVSHADVIKSVLADALGTHLDLFQRIHVDPASLSIIRYTEARPFVLGVNTTEGSLAHLQPPARGARGGRGGRGKAATDAVVGGGAGPAGATGTAS